MTEVLTVQEELVWAACPDCGGDGACPDCAETRTEECGQCSFGACFECGGDGRVRVPLGDPEAIAAQVALVDLAARWVVWPHIYVVEGRRSGLVKIGRARYAVARFVQLQGSSPEPLRLRALLAGGTSLESALHSRCADFRQHGEWFDPAALDRVLTEEFPRLSRITAHTRRPLRALVLDA